MSGAERRYRPGEEILLISCRQWRASFWVQLNIRIGSGALRGRSEPRAPGFSRAGASLTITTLPARKSDLDLQANLDDLRDGNSKIRSGKVGVEMHRGKQAFAPDRHPGHIAAWDNHNSSRIKRYLLHVNVT